MQIDRDFRFGSVNYKAKATYHTKEENLIDSIKEHKNEISETFGLVEVDGEEEALNGEIPEDFNGIPNSKSIPGSQHLPYFKGGGDLGEYEIKVVFSPLDLVPFHSYRKVELEVEANTEMNAREYMEQLEERFV